MNENAKVSGAELVELIPTADSDKQWKPTIGTETLAMLDQVPITSRQTVMDEALDVLSWCLPPSETEGSRTGLVIGYVQSGKTMSFTTVSALAHDNGFQLIIVITGTSVPLFKQSKERLVEDLRLQDRGRPWKHFANPTVRGNARRSIESALQRWKDSSISHMERQTVLITVMKHGTHLDNLIRLLASLDLRAVPTLLIDDEADQASLNNLVKKGKESPTYRRILELRTNVPHHTFLQYTATPQALLLINLIDVLSPGFGYVLTPGLAYTGGVTFFEERLDLVRRIPLMDVPTARNKLEEPPQSLLEAMRIFFIGAAAGSILGPPPHNRSMMVHPSKNTLAHADYSYWVNAIMRRWQGTLALAETDPDRQELVVEFRDSYDKLATTTDALPPFNVLINILSRVIRETIPTTVNARQGQTPEIDWKQDYAHLLIGGQALDRGYTVEGLTVTYMPRGQGVGNADTIQQRARWFGYKAAYLGFCRVYLAEQTFHAYQGYVEHEEDVRGQLRQHLAAGRSLDEWKRLFLLDSQLRPTRHNVLDLDYVRGNFARSWFEPRAPHYSKEALEQNRALVQEFCSTLQFAPDSGDERRLDAHRHLVAIDVPLTDVYANFLTPLTITGPNDSLRYMGLLLQIRRYLEQHRDAPCTVYRMRPKVDRPIYRTVDQQGEIPELFQGAYPDKRGEIYPGDRTIRSESALTIQIHHLDEVRQDGEVIALDVPVVAIWIPRDMTADWLLQDQGDDA
ncbi:MAG: Z1 domain-containing protein [Candidatus Hydrogenedentes bacterium]|nr:Z1 domain-containing protein [Candidatus Hydrogenedentota bacterium]